MYVSGLSLFGELFAGNLVKQLLQPAKRTQKAAYKAFQQHAEQNERTGDVIKKSSNLDEPTTDWNNPMGHAPDAAGHE